MKKSRFTEEQIAYALKQAELGMAVGEICRKMGIAEAMFYVWRKKYGGLGPSELKRLRVLEEENRKLKQLVADLSLDKAMLQEVVAKKTRVRRNRRAEPAQRIPPNVSLLRHSCPSGTCGGIAFGGFALRQSSSSIFNVGGAAQSRG